MGISTDGIICCGISFGEGYKFPWNLRDEDENLIYDDIEDWWLMEVCNYKEYYNYNEDYTSRQKSLKENPCPAQIVYHCSDERPMHILAVSGTYFFASRGAPEELNLNELKISEEKKNNFIDFCQKYCLPPEDTEYIEEFPKSFEPKWYLASWYLAS